MNSEALEQLRKYGAVIHEEENGVVNVELSKEVLDKLTSPEQLPEETREEWKNRTFAFHYSRGPEVLLKLLAETGQEGEELALKTYEECKKRWPHIFKRYKADSEIQAHADLAAESLSAAIRPLEEDPDITAHKSAVEESRTRVRNWKPPAKEPTYTLQWWNGVRWETKSFYQNLTWEKWESMREDIHKNYDHYGTPWRLITDEVVECNFSTQRPRSLDALTAEADSQELKWFGVPLLELTRKELRGAFLWCFKQFESAQAEVHRLRMERFER